MLTLYIALMGTVATLLILWVELASAHNNRAIPAKHTPECLKWQAQGTKDARCHAPHDTAWFGPRAEAELLQTFDHQIGTRHE